MSPQTAEPVDVFVSFTGADVAWAEWVAAVVEQAGYTVRFQRWDFAAGSNYVTEMTAALAEAKRLVMVISRRYWTSVMATAEWTAAFARDPALLLPVRIEDVAPPALLAPLVPVDLFDCDEAEARTRMIQALAGPGRSLQLVRWPGLLGVGWPSAPAVFEAPLRPPPLAGRDQLLAELRQRLAGVEAVALTQALAGPGGVGKTVLAAEYAWRHRSDYQLVWWVPAEQSPLILDSYVRLAPHLGVTVPDNLEGLPALVGRALAASTGRWLLVFDNAPDHAAVAGFLPPSIGHVLITSRNPAWGGPQVSIDVGCLDQPTAARYLLARTWHRKGEPPQGERVAAEALAAELGGLPLALAQAGAYLDAYAESLTGYLGLFRAQRARLLADAPGPLDYQGTVHTAVTLALARLGDQPTALALLELLAFLGPEAIPLEPLLNDTGEVELPAELAELAGPGRAHERNRKAIGPLRAVSLVERDTAGVRVHRLTQAIITDQLPPDRRADRLGVAVGLVDHALDLDPEDPKHWARYAALLPAARAVADHTHTSQTHQPTGLSLLHRLGIYLLRRGDLAGARTLQEQVLAGRRQALGDHHPDTLRSISNLATTLQLQGDLAGARTLFEQALAGYRQALGDHHPDTLASINNLALTLWEQGDLAGARALAEEALAGFRQVLGDRHPDTLRSINNLALTLRAQGDLAGARTLHEQALAGYRQVLGDHHPDTLRSIGNLAATLRAQGDLAGAHTLFEQALAGYRQMLGDHHPDTLRSINNLAVTLKDQGDLAAARTLAEQALAGYRQMLGDHHPDTLRSINNLAVTLKDQGDLAGAHTLHEQALAGRRQTLGDHHPDTLLSINNLANTLRLQGELAAARTLAEQALAGRREVLGDRHPDTLDSINDLANTLQTQGDLTAARTLHEQALAGRREVLGDRHPETLESIHNLAETLRAQGELVAARALHEEALVGRREVLDERHHRTVESAWNLYCLLGEVDPAAAAAVLDRDLRWLLDQPPEALTADQARIRGQVAEELRTLDPGP